MNSCVGNKKYLSVAGNKGREREWVALFTYASCAARVTFRTEFHRHLRVPSVRDFPSTDPSYVTRVFGLHARTEYVLRNDTRDFNSKLKGAASGVNEHDIRRERHAALLVHWRDYPALLAFERLTNRHIRRVVLHRRYVDGVWIKQDMQSANEIVYRLSYIRNKRNVLIKKI